MNEQEFSTTHDAATFAAASRILVLTSPDIAATIGRPGLLEARATAGDVVRRPAMRSDVLLGQLRGIEPPPDAPPAVQTWVEATISSVAADASLIMFSLHPEFFTAPVYRHRETGWLGTPPADWKTSWDDDAQRWLRHAFAPTPDLAPAESVANLDAIFTELCHDDRAVVVFNVSTYDPVDHRHRFTEDARDPYAVLANRVIAGLENLASVHDILVVDVDGALAELGGAQHIPRAGAFSPEAADYVTDDAVLAVDQSGVLGASLQAPVMRLEVPPYDRRTRSGVIVKWHVTRGATVAEGAPLFDLRFDGLHYKVEGDDNERLARRRTKRRRATSTQSMTMQVAAGSTGYVHEILIDEGMRANVCDAAAVMTPAPPDGAVAFEGSEPAFRLGMRLLEH